MDLSSLGCRVPGCGGPKDGVCINGLSFDECPDVAPPTDEAEFDLENAAADDESSGSQPLAPSGRSMKRTADGASLNASTCDALLRQRGGTVVGIVAGPEAGKTTMIATIYELLHRRKLDGYRFAGSETLRGYEERCHLARVASNRERADTARTPNQAKLNFTHLRVGTGTGIADVVFSDRSGEHFDNVLDQPTRLSEFAELARADVILVLVELDRLAEHSHPIISYARRLVMGLRQYGLLENKILRLVGTKADRLEAKEPLDETVAALASLAEDLTRRAGGNNNFKPLVTASRKRRNGEGEHGLKELLDEILQPRARAKFELPMLVPEKMTEMDALMFPYWAART
ncbi:TRAFAC clade GTPase domain-containing protein [Cupriavidus basilensis]|uniref:TRAFAC clade GTPase domain-containing protein n=1 Tax=Cupriavidus basilensis TaxID=68895 RepID=UPI0020A6473E|nr:hypothetical protein [Cupriavidus basilensis]MCP3024545.1 hypothetical protein [Cupriavidus basilensis]